MCSRLVERKARPPARRQGASTARSSSKPTPDAQTRGPLEEADEDLKERRFIEHTLQLAIQACLDAASHVVSDQRLGEPEANQELFRLLAQAGRISTQLATNLRAAAGFRNILVHGYTEVDVNVTRDVLAHHLQDLLAFAVALRSPGG